MLWPRTRHHFLAAKLWQLDPGLTGENFQRFLELDSIPLHHKVKDRAAGLASEAIKSLLHLVHGERRRFFRMKRTQADVFPSPALQRYRLTDQRNDINRGEYQSP